jgi:hypothetical protein
MGIFVKVLSSYRRNNLDTGQAGVVIVGVCITHTQGD